jgi:hypothetical protein
MLSQPKKMWLIARSGLILINGLVSHGHALQRKNLRYPTLTPGKMYLTSYLY